MTTIEAFRESLAADQAFSDELTREYGSQAGDARYDSRAVATARLVVLADKRHKATAVWIRTFRGRL